MRDEEMKHIPDEGEIVQEHTPVDKMSTRIPHCECGEVARPFFESNVFVGYFCPRHGGPLTHDAILWVVHPIIDVLS